MNRLLKRQLRRALQLGSGEDLESVVEALRAQTEGGCATADSARLTATLLQLIDVVGASYAQLERDLELRTRSLDISSAELFEVNRRLGTDLQAQREAQAALLTAANRLAASAGLPPVPADRAELSNLAQFLTQLVEQRAQAQRDRDVSQQRLKLALAAANLGLWDWNTLEAEVYFDEGLSRFVGGEPVECRLGVRDIVMLSHPDDRSTFQTELGMVLRGTKQQLDLEHRLRGRNGEWLWVQTFGTVTDRREDGRAMRVTGIVANITSRKQMEQRLADNLSLLETLLETLPLPVAINNQSGAFVRVNAAWEAMMGITRDDIIGRTQPRASDDPNNACEAQNEVQLLASGGSVQYETEIVNAAGEQQTVLITKAAMQGLDGEITGTIGVTTDISVQKRAATELQRAKQAAEAAAAAKTRFLANMSHELRTPLNGVVGMASLLATTDLDPRQQRFVHTLKSSAEALITIVDDILDISKIEAGKLDVMLTTVELRRELDQVLGLFAARAYDKGIELISHIAPGTPLSIETDPMRLRQVLGNLVSNAIKFTTQGVVLVSVSPERSSDVAPPPGIRIDVLDSGMGVPADQRERIFEPFAQADESVTRRFGGTGLGLAICRELVGRLGGRIGVESQSAAGSRFFFTLPVNDMTVTQAASGVDPGVTLIVARNPVIRGVLCEAAGYRTASVRECDSASALPTVLAELPASRVSIHLLIDLGEESAELDQAIACARNYCDQRGIALSITALVPPASSVSPSPGLRVLTKPVCTVDAVDAVDATTPITSPAKVCAPGRRPVAPDALEGATTMDVARKRVLVIEDNAVNQELARAMLQQLGFEPISATNGQQGVDLLEESPDVVLVLMDCQMPVMDGFTAAQEIRQREARTGRPRVPIIALTGNAMPGDREACLTAGMDDYLAKPFVFDSLRDKIEASATRRERPAAIQVDGDPSWTRAVTRP